MQRGGARILHGRIQGYAGSLRNSAEVEAARKKRYRRSGGDACAVQDESLRAAWSVVRNLESGGQRSRASRGESNADGAARIGGESRRAGIGLRETGRIRARDGDGIDVEGLAAGVNNRKHLGGTAGTHGDAAKVGRRWEYGCGGTCDSLNWTSRDGKAARGAVHAVAERRARNLGEIPDLLVNLIGMDAEGVERIEIRPLGIGNGGAQGPWTRGAPQ